MSTSPSTLRHGLNGSDDVQVTPFSRWERELPKLVGDERYMAVPNMKERKVLFDEFCRSATARAPAAKAAAAATSAAVEPAAQAAANGDAEPAAAVPPAADAEEGETKAEAVEEAAASVPAEGKAEAEAAFR